MPKYDTRQEAREALQQMVDDYGATLPSTFTKNPLIEAINASPDLRRRLVTAVEEGYLERFDNSPGATGAGAGYNADEKMIRLHHSNIGSKYDLIFVLGHETQHALSEGGVNRNTAKLADDIRQIGSDPNIPHDYTPAVRDYVEGVRAEEAQAHIGGFNALHSALAQKSKSVTLEAMYDADPARMRDFIQKTGDWPFEKYAMRPGLTLEPNGVLAPYPDNVEAMKTYYSDKMPGTFGSSGLLNYRQSAILEGWNAAHVMEMNLIGQITSSDPRNEQSALQAERLQTGKPFLYHDHGRDYVIDFDQLGVNRELLRAPLSNIVHAPDKGAEGWRLVEERHQLGLPRPSAPELRDFVTSSEPKKSGVVDRQTAMTALGYVEVSARSSSFLDTFASFFSIEENPSNRGPTQDKSESPLLAQASAALQKLGPDGGLGDPESLKNASAALALQAQKDGLTSIDQVVKGTGGDRLIAVQGQDPTAPDAKLASVAVAEAVRQPAEESVKRLQEAPVARTQEIEQPQRTQTQSLH